MEMSHVESLLRDAARECDELAERSDPERSTSDFGEPERRQTARWLAGAAAVSLLLLGGVVLFWPNDREVPLQTTGGTASESTEPTSSSAAPSTPDIVRTLYFADGSAFDLAGEVATWEITGRDVDVSVEGFDSVRPVQVHLSKGDQDVWAADHDRFEELEPGPGGAGWITTVDGSQYLLVSDDGWTASVLLRFLDQELVSPKLMERLATMNLGVVNANPVVFEGAGLAVEEATMRLRRPGDTSAEEMVFASTVGCEAFSPTEGEPGTVWASSCYVDGQLSVTGYGADASLVNKIQIERH